MLTKKVEEALNHQIAYEAYASSSYLSMASWCEVQGLRGATAFFYAQSAEERVHMLKIIRYINIAGGHALIPAVKEPANAYKSLKDVVETSLHQEQDVTKQINKLVELSFEAKDFATHHFLQWYVAEQLEEENLFTTILNIIKLGGKDEQRSLLIIDNEIAKIRGENGESSEEE